MIPAKPILREGVYEGLRQQIISGQYAPGEQLGEERLALEYGVSRTPLREALRKIAEEGLVEYIPFRGARVVRPTAKLVEDIFIIREALEGVAAREAARHASSERLAAMRSRFEGLRPRIAAGDLDDLGDAIHDLLFEESNNARLLQLNKTIVGQVHWLQHMAGLVPGRLAPAFREHESILSALEARDPHWAESSARAHIRNTLRDLQDALKMDDFAAAAKSAEGRRRSARLK